MPEDVIRTVRRWTKTSPKKEDASRAEALRKLPETLSSAMYDFQKDGFHFVVQKEGRCLIADEMGMAVMSVFGG